MHNVISQKIEIVHQYRGELFAGAFQSVVEAYPDFEQRFVGLGIRFTDEPGFLYRGSLELDESEIVIGLPLVGDGVSRHLGKRFEKRFGIPEELIWDERVGGSVISTIGIAHELGHCIQDDRELMIKEFDVTFPDATEETEVHVPDLDDFEVYREYVNRPDEVHADYIAATALPNMLIGQLLELENPEPRSQWREWANTRLL